MEPKTPKRIKGQEKALIVEKIQRVKGDHNITQAYVGRVLGIDESHMSRIMSQEYALSVSDAIKLHYEFNVDLNYALADDHKYSLYCSEQEFPGRRFDYLLGEILDEIEQAPKREHDDMIAEVYIRLGEILGIKIKH